MSRSTTLPKADMSASSAAKGAIGTHQSSDDLGSLMAAAQAGDRAAYEHLLRECIPFIKMVVRRAGVPVDYVDDAVQETLIAIHRFRQTYDPGRPFGAWLRTIAQRRSIDLMRSVGRTSLREVHEPLAFENHSDSADSPEEKIEQSDRRSVASAAIADLPAKQRQAVELLALKGKSLMDAAAATGLTPGALKVNLHRALNTLREGALERAA